MQAVPSSQADPIPDIRSRPAEGGVIDGDFLVLRAEATPVIHRPVFVPPSSPPAAGMRMLGREARAPFAPFTRRGGWRFWLGGLLLAGSAFWISGGHAWLLPEASRPSRPQVPGALTLTLLGSETEAARAGPVLRVEAEARNTREQAVAAQPLSIIVVTGKGQTVRHEVTPPQGSVPPGGRQRFVARLPIPGGGVRSVALAFAQ